MRLSIAPARNKKLAYGLYTLSLGLLVGSVVLAVAGTAQAVAPGTDWGPAGVMAATDSAVTVDWNNGGSTPVVDQVPRNSSQVLPHTGGKTYADIDPTINTTINHDFSGMSLTVSQTTGLQHQAVNLSLTGVSSGTNTRANGLTVMQCWGSTTEAQPDPTHCQDGAGFVDSTNINASHPRAVFSGDSSLTAGGDLKAATNVNLAGNVQGATATLVATVIGLLPIGAGLPAATGAAGHVEFDDISGTAVATVALSDGQASTTVPVPPTGTTSSYTAKYLATDGENYLSSTLPSPPVTLPTGSTALPSAPTSGSGTNGAPDNLTTNVPFQSVDGIWTSTIGLANEFSQTTTNEVGAFAAGTTTTDTVSRTFEMQTGAESPGLGCGSRTDQPSTSVCWLVAIPVDGAAAAAGPVGSGALTPSLWAQRVQVKLGFADVGQSCGSGARELSAGSELLLDAVNSWIPALCSDAGVDLGYIQTGDAQARSQYSSQSDSLIFTSSPVDDSGGETSTLYAPAGLSAVTIGLLARNASTGKTLTGLKLNARLVLKLLTESYQDAIDTTAGNQTTADLPWEGNLPVQLTSDFEFQDLNTQLSQAALSQLALGGSDIVVTVSGTDATTALWSWILSDPDAKAFLDGCPDSASGNTVINPFYSTRTYAECPAQAAALEATASAERTQQSTSNPRGTNLPSTYVDTVPQYPPTGAAFPQPGYYERSPITNGAGAVTQTALTLADLHPRENTLAATATDSFRGQEKSLNDFCNDNTVCPNVEIVPPGVWISDTAPNYGSGVMGLTDGTSAAKDLLPTALLCDDSGADCVGANDASLQKAAGTFVPASLSSHFLQSPATPDYADGAYPLTIPVYAEINTQGLDATDASAYAKVLEYISTTGQQQGFAIGNLPPGMAPLTDTLTTQTASAIATLQEIANPPAGNDDPSDGNPSNDNNPPLGDQLPPVGFVPSTTGKSSSTPTPQAMAGPTGITPASSVGFLPFGVGTGVLGALAAGIAAPVVGRKRRAFTL